MLEQPIKVLLIEDNPGDARLLREMLADVPSVPVELTHVELIRDALEMLKDNKFDVILSDLSLPDSQGLSTFLRASAHSAGTPIIVLTGLDDPTVAMRAVQKGAQDYLVKSTVNGEMLVRSLRYAIERQRAGHYRAVMMEREHLAAAVAQMSDGIVVTDGEWRITTANRAARLLLNLPESGSEGSVLEDALRPFELSVPLDQLRTAVDSVTPLEISRPNTKPPLYLDARFTRLFDQSCKLTSTVLTLRDVTAERHARQIQSNFFTAVSHKLRTPLTVLSGYFALFRQMTPQQLAEDWKETVEVCDRELKRLGDVIRTLLEFKSNGLRTPEVAAARASLPDAAAEVLGRLRNRYPERRIEATLDIPPDAAMVEASANHIIYILEKLLDNAVKFTTQEPVHVAVRAHRVEGGWLRVGVTDNGPGIPHEYFDRILSGFVQVEDYVTGQVPGLGVGLYLARQIVEAYGGSISIQSRLGQGSTISFTIPSVRVAVDPAHT